MPPADLKKFEQLVEAHDLTYSYSDDHRVWRAGQAQRDEIMELAKQLPLEDVERIWNAAVDRKLTKEVAADWYWRG